MKSLSLAVIASIMLGSGCTSVERPGGTETVSESFLEEIVVGEVEGAKYLVELNMAGDDGGLTAINAYFKKADSSIEFDACPVSGSFKRHTGAFVDLNGIVTPTYREEKIDCNSSITLIKVPRKEEDGLAWISASVVVVTGYRVEQNIGEDRHPRTRLFENMSLSLGIGERRVENGVTVSIGAL